MAYEVFFQDKTSTIVDVKDGEAIKALLLKKGSSSTPLEINGEFYRSSQITSIKHATEPTVHLPDWDRPSLPERTGPKCKAQYSIQREINDIAKSESNKVTSDNPEGLPWSKLIRDKKWREQIRQKLRTSSMQWCDHKARECHCEEASLAKR